MSKKIKKIILIIGVILISIIGCSTKVNALTNEQVNALNNAFTSGNETLSLVPNTTGNSTDLALNSPEGVLCVEGGKDIGWTRNAPDLRLGQNYGINYTVSHYIKIEGNTAKLYANGNLETPVKTVTDSVDALRIGYILALEDGWQNHENAYGITQHYSTKQYWMWHHFDVIRNLFPNQLNEINSNDGNPEYYGYDADSEAIAYANNHKNDSNNVSITDKTNVENIKLSTVRDGNNEYYRVGPYKWDYEGNISSVSVYDTNNKKIDSNNIKYAYYDENNKIQIKNSASEGIRDNKNFYILIDKKTNISGISKVSGKVKKTIKEYTGDIWFVKHKYNGQWEKTYIQDIVATQGKFENKEVTVTVETEKDVPFLGRLRIIKASSVKRTQRLDGAQFIIRRSGTTDYLKIDYDKENGYYVVDPTKLLTRKEAIANPLITGEKYTGYIDVYKMPAGSYDILEVKAPNGYFLSDGTQEGDYVVVYSGVNVSAKNKFDGNMDDLQVSLYGMVASHLEDNQHIEYGSGKKYSSLKVALYYSFTGSTNVPSSIKGDTAKEIINSIFENKKVGDSKVTYDELNKALQEMKNDADSKKIVQEYIARTMSRWIKGNETAFAYNDGYVLALFTKCYGWQSKVVWNKPKYGDLLIKKVDAKNPDKVLNNVGFIIKCTSSEVDKDHVGSYVTVTNGKVIYDKRIPQYFMTGTDGKTSGDGQIFIKDLDAGTYEAIEVTVGPNIYYKIEYTQENPLKITIEAGKTEEGNMKTATNTQEYVDISGYVWEDKISGKTSVRNALYNENDYDDNDILMNGIKVVLKDEGGNIVEDSNGNPFTATTKGKGYYIFKKVDTENLENYHVEFTYDGLTYQNVTPHIDKDNGSKAAEGNARTTFNSKFTEITNNTTIDGKKLTYTFENHVSTNTNKGTVGAVTSNSDGSKSETVESLGDFPIKSTTANAKLNIKDKFTDGMTEIKNINLGLYEREQPDLAIVKDIQNAKVMVNGYEHTYKYDTRADGTWDGDGFNVGVKFGNEYGSKPYTRAIYKSDVDFNPGNDKELKVKVTYKIAIRNESTNLTSKVNSIVDYYDSKYILEAAGTGLDNRGNITNVIAYTNDSYNNDYNKAIITTNTTIDAQKETYIYVQFSMDKNTVLGIMFDANGKEIQDKLLLDNVAEINSYTTYKDGALYAGIDKDSRPGNAIAGNKDSYEDDTDAAPGLQLVVADARKITGSVFLDATSDELQTGEERLGNGKYDDGENTIAGIPVKLIDENGTTVKETTTDENGNFEISEFIPGRYKIVYEWGNEQYPVTDYKSTIWTSENVNEKNTLKEKWYTGTEKYSDAMDNYETRQKIDAGENITTMEATTPIMKFGVEFGDTKMTPGVDKVEFIVENVDFGIVERPRQKLDISKKVSHIKLTLANGQELFNTDVPWDGTIKGLTYMAPSANTVPANGYLKAEIDNELIQGSTIEITYTITVANKGEVDYDSENYYKYGTDKTNIIKVQPTGVYDYLDSTMAIDTTKAENSGWEIVSKEDYDNKYTDTIVEKYFKDGLTTETDEEGNTITKYRWETSEGWYTTLFEEWATSITESRTVRDTKLSNKTILHNSKLEEELEPGKETNVSIYTSKILANTDEIDLNNDVEITEVKQTGKTGRIVTPSSSKLYDRGETTTVTPPTGENQNYILIIAISISALIILGTGIVFIKKKILK